MDAENLAARFEAERGRLRAVAYRLLGSAAEAEDAVQEAWLRLARTDADEVRNLSAWLTTVVSRLCLDMLRARNGRREDAGADDDVLDAVPDETPSPEAQTALADAVGYALQVVLAALAPAERIAFVLHDLFAIPFADIALILDRSEPATRQLASRARRRVQGAAASPEADFRRKRALVDAFLAASRDGDMQGLLAVLDPDVVFRGDPGLVVRGGHRGAQAVANLFVGRAQGARTALVGGDIGVAVMRDGRLFLAMQVTLSGAGIAAIDVIGDPARLKALDPVPLQPEAET